MPPKPLVDLAAYDLNQVQIGVDEIRQINPHRFEIEQVSGIFFFDLREELLIGFKDTRPEEFWVRGHLPGFPVMPGVMMIESAAQFCTYYYKQHYRAYYGEGDQRLFGLTGLERVRFRGMVFPGQRLIVVIKGLQVQKSRALFDCQGFVNRQMAFEARILGMPMATQEKENQPLSNDSLAFP